MGHCVMILWHVNTLIGNDCEIISYTTGVIKQRIVNSKRNGVFCAVSAEML
jgi:hypothetical protein